MPFMINSCSLLSFCPSFILLNNLYTFKTLQIWQIFSLFEELILQFFSFIYIGLVLKSLFCVVRLCSLELLFVRGLCGLGIRVFSQRGFGLLWEVPRSIKQGSLSTQFLLSLCLFSSRLLPSCTSPCLPVTFPSSLSPSSLISFFLFYIDRMSSRQRSLEGHPCLHLC